MKNQTIPTCIKAKNLLTFYEFGTFDGDFKLAVWQNYQIKITAIAILKMVLRYDTVANPLN